MSLASLAHRTILDPRRLLKEVERTSLPADIAALAPDDVVLQGFLRKLHSARDADSGDGGAPTPGGADGKRRWFVLTRTALSWRKSQDAPAPGRPAAVAVRRPRRRFLD